MLHRGLKQHGVNQTCYLLCRCACVLHPCSLAAQSPRSCGEAAAVPLQSTGSTTLAVAQAQGMAAHKPWTSVLVLMLHRRRLTSLVWSNARCAGAAPVWATLHKQAVFTAASSTAIRLTSCAATLGLVPLSGCLSCAAWLFVVCCRSSRVSRSCGTCCTHQPAAQSTVRQAHSSGTALQAKHPSAPQKATSSSSSSGGRARHCC